MVNKINSSIQEGVYTFIHEISNKTSFSSMETLAGVALLGLTIGVAASLANFFYASHKGGWIEKKIYSLSFLNTTAKEGLLFVILDLSRPLSACVAIKIASLMTGFSIALPDLIGLGLCSYVVSVVLVLTYPSLERKWG